MLAVYKSKSFGPFRVRISNSAGRTSSGKLSVYHRGGGCKRTQRVIDYYRYVVNLPGVIIRVEYDAFRRALLSLVCFSNGVICYVPYTAGTSVGFLISNSWSLLSKSSYGSAAPLRNFPMGSFVNSVERRPLSGASLLRSFGAYGRVMSKSASGVTLRLKSGKLCQFNPDGFAVLGTLAEPLFRRPEYKKAGFLRNRGWRPVVRGVAMNPIDHPHGGGEGKSGAGRPSVSR